MTHKPGCQANISCLVNHLDGVCDKYKCTCDLLGEKSAERLRPLPEKIERDKVIVSGYKDQQIECEKQLTRAEEKINEILDYLKEIQDKR